jgi:hypothetical protein
MMKVCLSVADHELGFNHCLDLMDDPMVDTPSVKDNSVKNTIRDRDHFTGNKVLSSFLRPVIDALGRLERASTTIGDIWRELTVVYQQIKSIDVQYARFEDFKRHCERTVVTRSKAFDEDIFFIGFFLHPLYRKLAVSQRYSIDDMVMLVLALAKKWGFGRLQAKLIKDEVYKYYNNQSPYSKVSSRDALQYWLSVPSLAETEPIKDLAVKIMQIVPHAAGVEGLFSLMSNTKTKARDRMDVGTLRMISQLKLHFIAQARSKSAKQSSKPQYAERNDPGAWLTEYDFMTAHDDMVSLENIDELSDFERGSIMNDTDAGLLVQETRELAFLETLFDFTNSRFEFEPEKAHAAEPDDLDEKDWDLNEI